MIYIYAEKTIEKSLEVLNRPVTVEIIVDGAETPGVGKENGTGKKRSEKIEEENKKGNPL